MMRKNLLKHTLFGIIALGLSSTAIAQEQQSLVYSVVNKSNLDVETSTYEEVTELWQLEHRFFVDHQPLSLAATTNASDANNLFIQKPGIAFLSSAVVPGSAQIAQKRWARAGVYLAVEALSLVAHLQNQNRAEKNEKKYYNYVDNNWSVVKYANWLIDYNEHFGTNTDLLNVWNPGASQTPQFDNDADWAQVNLDKLHQLERQTKYFIPATSPYQLGSNFSHVVPEYGSQQYYELASKYYQFVAGWHDFSTPVSTAGFDQIQWNTASIVMLSEDFDIGRAKADRFNNQYRYASNWMKLLVVNHIFAAFDGLFTAKIGKYKLQTTAPMMQSQLLGMRVDF